LRLVLQRRRRLIFVFISHFALRISHQPMCGIAGIVGGGTRETLERMNSVIEHRGPDDAGVEWFDGRDCGLAHRRLSILDLSAAGHQPMLNERGTRWLTYNGEVFNFLELRAELAALGHRFRSNSDTEVILAAFDEWGPSCVRRFNGMFAFAIYDTETRELFMARDHLGIKPLYYVRRGSMLAFASEAKALFEIDGVDRRPDRDAIISTLMLLWVPEPKTGFEGVMKLEAGHYATWRDGVFTMTQYWDVPVGESERERSEGEYVEELREILERAVRRQMISDVPVGALLSGGLDSSLVVALMRKVGGGDIDTYTIAFTEEDKRMEAMPDDARYAQIVARHVGTRHSEIVVRPDINDLLPRILWHLDDPIADGAAINTYLISRGARDAGTTVLLSGMGADEIFGGYRKHLATLLISRYHAIPSALRRGLIEPLVGALPVAIGGRGLRPVRWAKKFLRSAALPPMDAFIRGFGYYSAEELSELLVEPFDPRSIDEVYAVRRYHEMAERVKDLPIVDRMTYLDTKLFLPGLNLAYTDKASMAASIETRPPLIDIELVEFAARLPARYKINGRVQKYLLKKAAEAYLPHEVIYRPKAAFGTPIRAWMKRGLADSMRERLGDARHPAAAIIDRSYALGMLDRHVAGREDNAHRLWGLYALATWLEGQQKGSVPSKAAAVSVAGSGPAEHRQP
jgi:asparagine synthase (glutamine-hydrolysing)